MRVLKMLVRWGKQDGYVYNKDELKTEKMN